MAKQQVGDDNQWWPRIKDWLAVILVLTLLALLGWIFFLEAKPSWANAASSSDNCGYPHATISRSSPGESAEACRAIAGITNDFHEIGFSFIASAQPGQGQMPGWDMWDPGWTQRRMWDPGHMGQGQRYRMLRHWTFMHQGVPAEYRGQASTVAPTDATVREGAVLYAETCASCHGPTGLGDGEAGRALNPSPALLAYMIRMPMAVDEYLFWTISEGGESLGTAMPAFKDVLSAEEIWKVIAFLRAGFPNGVGPN